MPGSNMITMSFCNPNFLEWQLESAKIHLHAGVDGLTWHNSEMEPFQVTGDFSHWANEAFRKYLTRKFDPASLLSLDIQNAETFEMSTYLLGKYTKPKADIRRGDPSGTQITISTKESPFEDPIVREWTKFQRISLMAFFDQLTSKIRGYASEKNRSVALLGHLMVREGPAMFDSSFLSSLLVGKYFDVVHVPIQTKDIKVTEYVPEWSARFRLEPTYRMAKAAGSQRKPVWAYSGWKLDIPTQLSHTAPNLRKLTIAEAYAHGAIREIAFADWISEYESTGPPSELKKYLEFIWRNQRHIRETASLARVAVVYSVPSFLWRISPLFGMHGYSQRASIHGFARALGDLHIPYDIVIFGHSDLYEDDPALKDLSKYDLVILPNVDCMNDRQTEALKQYAKQGGAIVASGEVATRDENYVRRSSNVLDQLAQLAGKRVALLTGQPEVSYWTNVIVKGIDDQASLQRIFRAVETLAKIPSIVADNRRLVSVNLLWLPTPSPRLILHIINYNYDFETDSVKTQEEIPVRIRIPTDFRVGRVECLSPDLGSTTEEVVLQHKMANSETIEFTIPRVFLWAMIAVRSEEDVHLESKAKIAIEEAKLAVEAAKKDRRTVGLAEAEGLLQASQDAYVRGSYEQATNVAIRAKEIAGKTTREAPETIISGMKELWPILLVSAVIVTGSYVLMKKRRIAKGTGRV